MNMFKGVLSEMSLLPASVIEQQGGLAALIDKFNQHGLGAVAQSWVSKGANAPVSAEQLQTVLGADSLAQLGKRLGLDSKDLAQGLTRLLPQLVDRLTPDGHLPKG